MKKLLTAGFLTVLFSLPMMAQKGKVNSALVNLQSGEVALAKDNIDAALQSEEVKIMSKAWLTKGDVYKSIYETKKGWDQTPNALIESKEAYFKAYDLEEVPKKKAIVKDGLESLAIYFYTEGVTNFSNSKWAPAYGNFIHTLEINEFLREKGLTKEVDTNAYFVVALSAFNSNQYDDAQRSAEKLMELGDNREVIYTILVEIYKQKGLTDKYLSTLNKGREKYPNNLDLLYKEINYYLENEKLDVLETKLLDAVKLDPTNHTLYQALANVYDKQGDRTKALSMYDKAIEKSPDFYEAYYNKAIVFFTDAMDLIEKMNEEKNDKKYEELYAQRTSLLKDQCLPLLEKAYKLKSDDPSVIKALREVYARLDMFEEMKKLPKN